VGYVWDNLGHFPRRAALKSRVLAVAWSRQRLAKGDVSSIRRRRSLRKEGIVITFEKYHRLEIRASMHLSHFAAPFIAAYLDSPPN